MAKQLLAPAKFQLALPGDFEDVSGAVFAVCGLPLHTLIRKKFEDYPHTERRFLDPQLYLSCLDARVARKTCANLASYPWFMASGVPDYDSGEQKQSQWKDDVKQRVHKLWKAKVPSSGKERRLACKAAIGVQSVLECASIILPSPLTSDAADDYGTELAWLDTGLEVAKSEGVKVPVFTTIAISDTCLRGVPAMKNELIDAIVDNVSSRNQDGAYVVLEQSNENGYYCTHGNTITAILKLVADLKKSGVRHVMVNYLGTGGLMALAVGADSWISGWYRGERRLRLADFADQAGRANPTYYSHALGSEFHLREDLDRVVAADLLGRVEDITDASKGLVKALKGGKEVDDVPEWRYSPSNIRAAAEHFMSVCARETNRLDGLSPGKAIQEVGEWLDGADKLVNALYAVGSFNPRTELNHQANWKKGFNAVVDLS
jgi:hypothetical protein